MRRLLISAAVAAAVMLAASLAAQSDPNSGHRWNHVEVGAYGDYFRVAPTSGSTTNFWGVGGRVGVNASSHVAIEGEVNYDFEQSFANIIINQSGIALPTTFTATVRPITGLFGPKFQLGTSGPVRLFVVAKAGFVDFTTNCNAPAGSPSCFTSSLNNFGGDATHFSAFPGGGAEFFIGPVGFRGDVGDQIYLNNGTAYNNLRVTFGPTIRF
jgi:opacity protein-like surface antigen